MSAHPTQLFSLLLSQGDFSRLAEAVRVTERRMKEAGESDLWTYWNCYALLSQKRLEDAKVEQRIVTDPVRAESLDLLIARAEAEQNQDPSPLLKRLEGRFEKTRDPLHLFELCESYYSAQRWELIANLAIQLVEEVGTASVLRLAIEAAQRAKRPRLVLDLLTGREGFFPDTRFPLDLRRGRVQALRQLGSPNQALEEAEEIAVESDESRDILVAVVVRLECADPKGAIVAARKLLDRDDVSADSYLRLANFFRIEDRAAANAHLERAFAKKEESARFVADAMDLSFKLSREDRLAELQPALAKAASEGGAIQLAGPERMLELIQAHAERREKAEALYAAGQIPLHLALEALGAGATLAAVYYSRFHPTEPRNWHATPPLYIRHGGRAGTPPHPITSLYVDISSLVIANELGILDLVEEAFAPVFLPHSAVTTLYWQIDQALPHQPTKLDEARLIEALVDKHAISVLAPSSEKPDSVTPTRPPAAWRTLAAFAREAAGVLLDYFPITVGFPPKPADLAPDEEAVVVNIRSVLESLEHASVLTSDQARFARARLGSLVDGSVRILARGTSVYLRGNIVEVLAGAGVLPAASEFFRLFIEEDECQRIKNILEFEVRSGDLRATLRSLVERIQRGLGKTWCLLPAADLDGRLATNLENRCLGELMVSAEKTAGAYVLIDDRFLNSFAACGKAPITTLVDVLRELRSRELLTADSYSACMHRLRLANLRFIPPKADEIVHLLTRAKVRGRQIVETVELATLRRYMAASVAERGRLQLPPLAKDVPNPHGELGLLFSYLEATREALVALWSNVSAENVAEIRSRADWLLHAIWCDASALSWIANNTSEPVERLHGSALAQLYIHGLGLRGDRRQNDPSRPSARALYFTWLGSRFAHDRESLNAAAVHLTSLFTKEQWNQPNVEPRMVNVLIGDFLHDLPDGLRGALKLPKTVLQKFGVEYVDAIRVEGDSFDGSSLWPAVEEAMAGNVPRVQGNETHAVFSVKYRFEGRNHVIELAQEGGSARYLLSDQAFGIFDREPKKRRQILKAHPEWFDCSHREFEREAKRIAYNADPNRRYHNLALWRQRSSANYYLSLQAAVGKRGLKLSDFVPPPSFGLLSHIRIPETAGGAAPFAHILEDSARDLLLVFGFDEAFRRLSALPCALPANLVRAFRALDAGKRMTWLQSAIAEYRSPASRIHVLEIVAQIDSDKALELIRSIVSDAADDEFEAFQLIQLWTISKIDERPEVARWAPNLRLAATWVHASRIFDLLIRGSTAEKIAAYFSNEIRPANHDVFQSDRGLLTDAAHPGQLTYRSFYIQAIASRLSPAQFDSSGQEQIATLLRRLSDLEPEKKIVHPELLLPTEWREDSMGSYLHLPRAQSLKPWLGETSDLFASEFISSLLTESFNHLHESITAAPYHWRILSAVIGLVELPEALKMQVARLASNSLLPEIVELDSETRKAGIWFLANQCAYAADMRKAFADQLPAIALRLEAKSTGAIAKEEDVTVITESAHALSTGEPSPLRAAREFSRIMIAILDAWPSAHVMLWSSLRGLTARLSPQVASGLWPLVFELRKRCPQSNVEQSIESIPNGEGTVTEMGPAPS